MKAEEREEGPPPAPADESSASSLTGEHARALARIHADPTKRAALDGLKELGDQRRIYAVAPSMIEEAREAFERDAPVDRKAARPHRERHVTRPEPFAQPLVDVDVPPLVDGNGKLITRPLKIPAPITGDAELAQSLARAEQAQIDAVTDTAEAMAELPAGRPALPTEPRAVAPAAVATASSVATVTPEDAEVGAPDDDGRAGDTSLSRVPSSLRATARARGSVIAVAVLFGAGLIGLAAYALRATGERNPVAPAAAVSSHVLSSADAPVASSPVVATAPYEPATPSTTAPVAPASASAPRQHPLPPPIRTAEPTASATSALPPASETPSRPIPPAPSVIPTTTPSSGWDVYGHQ